MDDRPQRQPTQLSFRDAVSAWQLRARTDVKQNSSLPSGMFDVCDPMLETRLAESVESMLQCLHSPSTPASDDDNPTPPTEMRVEHVAPAELQAVPTQFTEAAPDVDFDNGSEQEHFGILLDACTTGDDPVRTAARQLLTHLHGVDCEHGIEDATRALAAYLPRLLSSDDDDAQRLLELCRAVAATVVTAQPTDEDSAS